MASAPHWIFVGAVVERELDDVSDIWARATVVSIDSHVADLLYDDGNEEAAVPLSEVRPVAQAHDFPAQAVLSPDVLSSQCDRIPVQDDLVSASGDAAPSTAEPSYLRDDSTQVAHALDTLSGDQQEKTFASRRAHGGVMSQVTQLRLAAQSLERSVATMRSGCAERLTELESVSQDTVQAAQSLNACQIAENRCLASVRTLADELTEAVSQADVAALMREMRREVGDETLLALLLQGVQSETFTGEKLTYVRVPLIWNEVSTTVPGVEASVQHEVSQALVRPCGDLAYSYRIHRFKLLDPTALNARLMCVASSRMSSDAGVQVSNIGGYHSKQDLFGSIDVAELREFAAACVLRVAQLTAEAAGGAARVESSSDPIAWVNVSKPGDLNTLHHHGEHSFASSYYAQVPSSEEKALCGTLLFRLTPGRGDAHAEPHAERHIPWLCQNSCLDSSNPSTVEYVEMDVR
eukprot:TRINITY_DN59061_c0_g1_i1.p1 TRINITY_DN59061_c0_g1~~TRINITY_DN59061_c0_g1_i1.p1  ORF type:complete len:465 (+),score=45.94 TRINITY_DN59061_c0_g1_i1:150-1544(+)